MVTVITYGTYDLLHYGHIRLLERAKALGDYLIVGVTADDFDKTRGKINVQQSLMERIEALKATGIPDKIIVEEYEGQKIDDILRYNVDIFTVGSDWRGHFDYLNEYCKVVYLSRTEGVSSSDIRSEHRTLSLGLLGNTYFLNKVLTESKFVNGIKIKGICTDVKELLTDNLKDIELITSSYDEMLENVDAVYIRSDPALHYQHIKKALECGKHVLCESPMVLEKDQWKELHEIAEKSEVLLMEALKTAYATAYSRLFLILKSGSIGDIKAIDVTCTSLERKNEFDKYEWDCIYEWGPTALLPIFQLLGGDYLNKQVAVHYLDKDQKKAGFIKADFIYPSAAASIKIGNIVKSEGEMIISGTKGYIYVPAPWWKTAYFELRFENSNDNRCYFYQLDGEGIRYELVAFASAVEKYSTEKRSVGQHISDEVSMNICRFMEDFLKNENLFEI